MVMNGRRILQVAHILAHEILMVHIAGLIDAARHMNERVVILRLILQIVDARRLIHVNHGRHIFILRGRQADNGRVGDSFLI